MNTVNQTFNWSRFTATLCKEVVENKRMLLFSVIGMYGLLTMIMILGNLITHNSPELTESLSGRYPQIIIGMPLVFIVCVMASMAFKDLKTKAGRTYLLTSPSSTLEKFLVNLLIYCVGALVAYFACAQLADLTRICVLWAFRSQNFLVAGPINYLTSISDLAKNSLELNEPIPMAITILWLGVIANCGFYLAGSVLWPRLSLLKTFAAIYAVEFGLFLIISPIFLFIGDWNAFAKLFYEFVMAGRFSFAVLIWSIFQVVVLFGMAWYLFKRKDVVSLKWWK